MLLLAPFSRPFRGCGVNLNAWHWETTVLIITNKLALLLDKFKYERLFIEKILEKGKIQ